MIIAVEFDGTLCSENYPGIGNAGQVMIEGLKKLKLGIERQILWTWRASERLTKR